MLLYVKNLHLRIGACLPCSGTQASRRKLLLSPCRADVGSAKTRRVHRPAEAGFSFVEPRPKRATDIKKGACAAAEFCGAQAPFLRFWPCRVGEGAYPRRVGFTASAAGCVGHRSPSVSQLRYSRLDASLRSRPFAAANGRLPACVRAARRPVLLRLFPYGAGTARFLFGIGACAAALRPTMPQPTGRPLFAGPARVRSTRARTLASRQARTCGVLYGLRRTKQNRRRLRTAVSSRAAWRRARRAGRPERSPIWRLARMRLKRRRCGRGYLRHARSRSAFRKGNGTLPAGLLPK